LNGFSKTLAMEVRDYGIAVHSVCPGAVETRLSTQAMPDRDPSAFMHVDDVAHVCLFLATQSERAVSDEVVVRRFGSVPLGG
jgi:NAD(P)-dependent dehydrogenase (short-subunit alcohol dehydrogenase family)